MNLASTHAPAAGTPVAAILLGAAGLISRWDTDSLRVAVNTTAHGHPTGSLDHEPALRAVLAHLGIDEHTMAPGDLLDRWQQQTNPTNDELIHVLIAASKTALNAERAVAR